MRGLSGGRDAGNRGAVGNASIAASIFIAILLVLLLFGTKLGLPSDLISLFHKMRGIQVRPGDWKIFTSADGGYVVDLPGVPAVEAPVRSEGSEEPLHTATIHVPEQYRFTVICSDLRQVLPEGSDTEAFLAAARDSMVSAGKGRLLNDKQIRIDRFPGREFVAEGGGVATRARLLLKDGYLYSLGVQSRKEFVLSADADRFFASFKFISDQSVPAAAPGWAEFAPIEGRFSVQMPGLPVSDQQTFKTRGGDMVLYLFNLERGRPNERFSVQYTDYPEQFLKEARSADAVLKKASTVDAFNIEGKVVSEKALPLGRYPGRELQVENAELAMRIRLYLVEKRLYKVVATWPKSRAFSADDERFLNSFRLTQ